MKKIALRSVVSLFFIGLLFYLVREDLPEIARALKNINRGLFAAAVAIYLLAVLVMVKRLQLIFEAEELPMKFSDSLNVTFIGFFFNNFLPTAVGGDIVKAMCASRTTGDPVKSLTSVLMDRIFGLFTFIMIPSVSLLFFLNEIPNRYVPIVVYSFLAVSILFFFMIFNRNVARRFSFIETFLNALKLGTKARQLYDGLHKFKDHKVLIVKAMMLSIVGQSVNIFVIYLMAIALGAHTPILYFYLLVPVVHLISMLPSLNGLGIREGAYVYFLTPCIGRENAAAIGILWLALLFLLSLIGGVIYLVRHDYHVQFKKITGS